ncbi:hypothetical protein ACSVDE_17065 [Pseudalkalibacillus sp. Hm43]|uniref:hypothetical protein n=1 Tax=Pseudalkalibacillus sp. Hm43 TaxID=3450742 RepID=UPI003F434CCC
MKNKKVIFIAIVVSTIVYIYNGLYPITDIETFAEELNGPGGVAEQGEHIETVHIEGTDRYLVFIRTIEGKSRIQLSMFQKTPLLNRYEYYGTFVENTTVAHQSVETNKGMYTVLFGENLSGKLDHIEFTFYDEVFEIDVAGENFFVWYEKEPSMEEKAAKTGNDVYEMKLFDQNDEELELEDLF